MNRKHKFGSQLAVLGYGRGFTHLKAENQNMKIKGEHREKAVFCFLKSQSIVFLILS